MASDPVIVANLRLKSALTVACYVSFMVYALMLTMTFASSFSRRDEDHNLVSYLATGFKIKALAQIIGYLLNGAIFHKINKQIGIILSLILMTVASFYMVLSSDQNAFFFTNATLGFVFSMYNVCSLSLLLDVWQGKCPPFINGLYLLEGVVGFVSGLTGYFSQVNQVNSQDSQRILKEYAVASSVTQSPMANSTLYETSSTTSSHVIIFVLSLPAVLAVLLHTVLFFIQRKMANSHAQVANVPQPPKSMVYYAAGQANVLPHPGSQSKASTVQLFEESQLPAKVLTVGAIVIALSSAIFSDLSMYVPLNIRSLIPPFEGQLPSVLVSLPIVSMFSGFSFARLVGTLASIWVSPQKIVGSQLAIIAISFPMFFILAQLSSLWIFAGGVALGVGSSLIEPNIISALELKGRLNNFAVGCLLFASHLGGGLAPIIGMSDLLYRNSLYHSAFSALSLVTVVSLVLLLFNKFK